MMDNRMYWFNYDTNEYDFIDTPEDYAPYVPEGAARNLYHLYVNHMDKSPLEASPDTTLAVSS